nr:hypothetical protein [Tanacetum cinerariifolium]
LEDRIKEKRGKKEWQEVRNVKAKRDIYRPKTQSGKTQFEPCTMPTCQFVASATEAQLGFSGFWHFNCPFCKTPNCISCFDIYFILTFKGCGSFARALIELDGTCGLKDKCDNCKIFGHSCDNFPQWASTNKARSKDEKQKDILDDGFQTVKHQNWKNVMAPPRKTSIWSARKAERNIAFSPVTKLHYFDGDVLEFANMDQVVEEDEHGNVSSEHD